MRLITRSDTSLVVGLVVGAIIMFQQPLHFLLEAAREVETRYRLDLLSSLTTMSVIFIFHQYRKRQLAKAEAAAAAAAAAKAQARSDELERLMSLSRALANALDFAALQQALWRNLPAFVPNGSFWLLARVTGHWHEVLQDAGNASRQSIESLVGIAERAVADCPSPGRADGTINADTLCFPLFAGADAVGVLGIPAPDVLAGADRRAIGAAAGLISIALRNVELFRETRENSVRDSLTGCFNREHAIATLDGELRRAKRSLAPLSVVMFDVDHFKQVNDRLGHLRGDEVLRAVGAQVRRVLRTTDVPCRYGGDEFLVVLPDTGSSGAAHVAENLRREIGALMLSAPADERVRVTASVGYATAMPGELDVTALVSRADAALYEAKAAGRNRVCALAPPVALPTITATEQQPPSQVSGATILVADDEPLARELMRKSLEPRGYRILTAANGADAIATARTHMGPIHLLLTDVVMPDVNGLDLAQRMQSLRPGIRTLYVSGFAVPPSAHVPCGEGDGVLLQKPFELSALTEAVRRALAVEALAPLGCPEPGMV